MTSLRRRRESAVRSRSWPSNSGGNVPKRSVLSSTCWRAAILAPSRLVSEAIRAPRHTFLVTNVTFSSARSASGLTEELRAADEDDRDPLAGPSGPGIAAEGDHVRRGSPAVRRGAGHRGRLLGGSQPRRPG